MTDREHKIEYINSRKDAEYFNRRVDIVVEHLNTFKFVVAHELVEIIEGGVPESTGDNFLERLADMANDKLISEIDWNELNQCKKCDGYYSESRDFGSTESFCSEDCEENYQDIERYRDDDEGRDR
jgi:hypothetical protein